MVGIVDKNSQESLTAKYRFNIVKYSIEQQIIKRAIAMQISAYLSQLTI